MSDATRLLQQALEGHMAMDIYGYLWISMDIYGYLWISMDIYGYLWISMDIYGYPWINTKKNIAFFYGDGHPFTSYAAMLIFGDGYVWLNDPSPYVWKRLAFHDTLVGYQGWVP